MKVVRLRAPASVASLRLLEEEPPTPRAGEVLVRVRASSLNPHDDFVVRGAIPAAEGRIPLSDGAGEVVACGEGVTDLSVGDAVVSTIWPYWLSGDMTAATRRDLPGESVDGYAREYACMPAHAFTRAPPGYSHAQAATLPCAGLTAWRGLVVQGKVKPGDTVLILGSGSVSLFALQFAKAAGARVIATSSSEEKLEKLGRLGADDLINYKTTPRWGEQGEGAHRRSWRRSCRRSRRSCDVRPVHGRVPTRRPHRADRRAVGVRGRRAVAGAVLRADPRQRNLDGQPSQSGGHDSRDPREPVEAGDRSNLRSRADRGRVRVLPERSVTSGRSVSRSDQGPAARPIADCDKPPILRFDDRRRHEARTDRGSPDEAARALPRGDPRVAVARRS